MVTGLDSSFQLPSIAVLVITWPDSFRNVRRFNKIDRIGSILSLSSLSGEQSESIQLYQKRRGYPKNHSLLHLPHQFQKPNQLSYELAGLYSLRTSDYRIIYRIKENQLIIIVISVGHRKEIYKRLKEMISRD